MKCIVKGCSNHQHEGLFVGALCAPCYRMLTTGKIGNGATFVHIMRDEMVRIRSLWSKALDKLRAAINEI